MPLHPHKKHHKHRHRKDKVSLKPLPQHLAEPLADNERRARENIMRKQSHLFWMMCFSFLEIQRDMRVLRENEESERKDIETAAFLVWCKINSKKFELRYPTRPRLFRPTSADLSPRITFSRSQEYTRTERHADAVIIRLRHRLSCRPQEERETVPLSRSLVAS